MPCSESRLIPPVSGFNRNIRIKSYLKHKPKNKNDLDSLISEIRRYHKLYNVDYIYNEIDLSGYSDISGQTQEPLLKIKINNARNILITGNIPFPLIINNSKHVLVQYALSHLLIHKFKSIV